MHLKIFGDFTVLGKPQPCRGAASWMFDVSLHTVFFLFFIFNSEQLVHFALSHCLLIVKVCIHCGKKRRRNVEKEVCATKQVLCVFHLCCRGWLQLQITLQEDSTSLQVPST